MFHDAFGYCDKDPISFKDILIDSEKPLHLGSKHSKLPSLMKLYNIKGHFGWSDSTFSTLLEVLLPKDNNILKSIYEAKNQ